MTTWHTLHIVRSGLALSLAFIGVAAAQVQQSLQAQMREPVLKEDTVKVSEHVWAMIGSPTSASSWEIVGRWWSIPGLGRAMEPQ